MCSLRVSPIIIKCIWSVSFSQLFSFRRIDWQTWFEIFLNMYVLHIEYVSKHRNRLRTMRISSFSHFSLRTIDNLGHWIPDIFVTLHVTKDLWTHSLSPMFSFSFCILKGHPKHSEHRCLNKCALCSLNNSNSMTKKGNSTRKYRPSFPYHCHSFDPLFMRVSSIVHCIQFLSFMFIQLFLFSR